jgi:hypothetical protein
MGRSSASSPFWLPNHEGNRLSQDLVRAAVNADIPNSSVRKSGMLKIIEVLEG